MNTFITYDVNITFACLDEFERHVDALFQSTGATLSHTGAFAYTHAGTCHVWAEDVQFPDGMTVADFCDRIGDAIRKEFGAIGPMTCSITKSIVENLEDKIL